VIENDGGWREPGDYATELYFMNDNQNLYFGFRFFGDPWDDSLSAHYYLAIETNRDSAGTRFDNWRGDNEYIRWPFAPDYWIHGWINQDINPETFGDNLLIAVSDGAGGFSQAFELENENWEASVTNGWCEFRLSMTTLGLEIGDNFDVILIFRPDEGKPGLADTLPFDESTSDWADGSDDYVYAKQTFTILHSSRTPQLVYPENCAQLTDPTVNFGWSTLTDPSGVIYEIQIDDDQDFSSPVHENGNVSDNVYTYTLTTVGTYYWRVREGMGRTTLGISRSFSNSKLWRLGGRSKDGAGPLKVIARGRRLKLGREPSLHPSCPGAPRWPYRKTGRRPITHPPLNG
jgi:hypothetical protein